VFRTPIIFLISTFLSIGPNYFAEQHIVEVNRALAKIPVPRLATRTPLKRLPVKQPVHDPATCIICVLIHASVTAQFSSSPSLNPTALIGVTTIESLSPSPVIPASILFCRGPPIV
jgi:hypothetical protein